MRSASSSSTASTTRQRGRDRHLHELAGAQSRRHLSGTGIFASCFPPAPSLRIVTLLPVELILQSVRRRFAMVFALLIAAILWNLGTCISACRHRAPPLIGSIIGVGSPTSSCIWQRTSAWTGRRRPRSAIRCSCRRSSLHLLRPPPASIESAHSQPGSTSAGRKCPPPWWIPASRPDLHRRLFRARSNDGQKGMGLIMLILIGTCDAMR